MGNRRWTTDEEIYLIEKWGTVSVPAIAKNLERTVRAVKYRATSLHLGPVLMAGDYITFNQLLTAVMGSGRSYSYRSKYESWVEKRGLPVHTKKIIDKKIRVIYLKEFWEWAEKNRSSIDFSRMKPLALGAEPDWVGQQRKIDAASFPKQRKDPWTAQEDQRLAYLVKQYKYTYAEISRELRRSAVAIQKRCHDLGLKERPVWAPANPPWSDAELQLLADMIRQGCSYSMIGQACGGRSEKAVRDVVRRKYRTENADKVRAMLGDGTWGAGAPEPSEKKPRRKSRAAGTEVRQKEKEAWTP